jgi:hypothetical protein
MTDQTPKFDWLDIIFICMTVVLVVVGALIAFVVLFLDGFVPDQP